MPSPQDLRGHRFGRLTAIAYTHRTLSSGRRMPAWEMRCDCGNTVVAMTVNLQKGKHQSCGCATGELIGNHYPRDTLKPEYRVHSQMVDRCYLTTAPNFRWYGGKGVRVCDRWRFGENGLTAFQAFVADMGPRPEGLTLDRIDPFGDYEPDNCRWATWLEQAANKRSHHLAKVY